VRIFITGVSGLLGLNAGLHLKERHDVTGCYWSHPVRIDGLETIRLDLSDAAAVHRALDELQPQIILHTAGLTNVDACEDNPSEAERLNVEISEHVARAAQAVGAFLVHISTDHMSDGTKALVTETAAPAPLNVYAQTKWQAECAVTKLCPEALIVRTNFFGWGSLVKASFSDWVLQGLRQGKTLPLFVDVYITPILINQLVDVIERLLQRRATGIFNVAGRDRVSKFEFGMRLAKVFGYPGDALRPVSVRDVPLRAQRPLDMSLNTDKVAKAVGRAMPSVEDSLRELKNLDESGWRARVWDAMPLAGETHTA